MKNSVQYPSRCRSTIAALVVAELSLLATAPAQATNRPPRIATGAVAFTKQVLDTTVDQTHAVAGADFDRDGDMDVVATDFINSLVVLYRNDGRGGFSREVIDRSLGGAYPIGVGDVDRDGDVDVLSAGYNADLFVWYDNDGKGVFRRRDIGSWDGAHSIVAVDLDGDKDMDLLITAQDANQVGWYENDGANNFKPHVIDTAATGAKRAEPADLDGDGDPDAIAASFFANEVAWYQNDGRGNFTKRVIDQTATGAYFVERADLDRDGDIDVLAACQLRGDIVLYENLGAGTFRAKVVDKSALGARTVVVADIDGDGYPDPVSASVDDDTLAWHANLVCRGFEERAIDLRADAIYGATTVDMDFDGDVDVLAASRDDDSIAVHYQIQRHLTTVANGGRRTIDASVLVTLDPDDGPADLTYTLTVAPSRGRLELNGNPLAVSGRFRQSDVDAGRVVYVHDGRGPVSDGFAFTVQDGGENGVRPAAGDFTIVVTGIGDAIVVLPLDEGSGTVVRDISGKGNHGRLMNGATFSTSTPDGSAFSASFDGVDDYLDLGGLDVTGSGLTLACWFLADSFPGPARDPRLIAKATSVDADQHIFMLSTMAVGSATRLRGRLRIGAHTTTLVASSGDLGTSRWYHAAMTYNGSELRLYLDGVMVGATPLTGAIDTNASMLLAVGAQPPAAGVRYFDGLIDDVRILGRGMDATEVLALARGLGQFRSYGAGLPGLLGFAPRLTGWGCPCLNQTTSLDVSHGLPGSAFALVLGATPITARLFGGWLLVVPAVAGGFALSSGGSCPGTLSVPLSIPNEPGLVGIPLYWQAMLVDRGAPQGLSMTAGLEMMLRR